MEAVENLWTGKTRERKQPTKWRTFNDWIAVLPQELSGPYADAISARRVAFIWERDGVDCAVVKHRGRYYVLKVASISPNRVSKRRDGLGMSQMSPYIPVQGYGYYNPFGDKIRTFGSWLKRAGTRAGRETVRGARVTIRGTRRAAKWYGTRLAGAEAWGRQRRRVEFKKAQVRAAKEVAKMKGERVVSEREKLVEQFRTEREEAKTAALMARHERLEAEAARREAERGLYGSRLEQYRQKFQRFGAYGQSVGRSGAAVVAGTTPPIVRAPPPAPSRAPAPLVPSVSTQARDIFANLGVQRKQMMS